MLSEPSYESAVLSIAPMRDSSVSSSCLAQVIVIAAFPQESDRVYVFCACQAMRRLLHKHRVCVNNDVESILGARVPILKFKDVATGALPAQILHLLNAHAPIWRHHVDRPINGA